MCGGGFCGAGRLCRLPRSLCSQPWSQPPRTEREPRESYILLQGSASRKTYPRIMARAYLKAPCLMQASMGTRCRRVVYIGSFFTKGGARENRPPRGVEESMLIFEKECFRAI